MEIGKLYKTNQLFWLLYPSRDIAPEIHYDTHSTTFALEEAGTAVYFSDAWSKWLNCNVSYINLNSMFVLLEKDREYSKILSTEGQVGWIILTGSYKNDIEEVKVE